MDMPADGFQDKLHEADELHEPVRIVLEDKGKGDNADYAAFNGCMLLLVFLALVLVGVQLLRIGCTLETLTTTTEQYHGDQEVHQQTQQNEEGGDATGEAAEGTSGTD
jgi:hypothetical protein